MDIEDRLKLMRKKHRAPSNLGIFPYDGNVLGGGLIGVGMAVTGACPGTSLVQMGAGMANGFLVVLGGLLGAAAFVRLQPRLKAVQAPLLNSEPSIGDDPPSTSKSLDIATALGVDPITLLLVWVPMCLAVMLTAYATDSTTRAIPISGLVRPAYGGLLIGTAQLGTTLLTGHAVGASAAYEDVASWLDKRVRGRSEDGGETTLLTPSVIFSGGVVAAAALLSLQIPKIGLMSTTNSLSLLSPRNSGTTILGGACMVFGARLAGGCTSGHGISGLAKFSLASLATTVSMFTAGILTAGVGL